MPDNGRATAINGPLPGLAVCYVAVAMPVLSETFVTNEIRAVSAAGITVLPVSMARYAGACQPDDECFRTGAAVLGDIPAAAALAAAAVSPAGLARAVFFARSQTGLRPRSLLLAGARLALVARRGGCRHIHAHFSLAAAATAITAARLAGISCSFTAHGFDVRVSPSDLPLKLRSADFAVAVSTDLADDLRGMAPDARIELVYCGIDPDRFFPRPVPSNGRILAVGRLSPEKGWSVLIEALASLPPGHRPQVDAVGGGKKENELREFAARSGVAADINFLGAMPSGWIASEGPHYQGFVAPYIVGPDGSCDTGPLTVKEAMAMGLPVAASSLPGLREILGPDCGRLTPPGGAAALAEALVWLSGMSAEGRASAGSACRARVAAHFTLARQAETLSGLFRQAAASC